MLTDKKIGKNLRGVRQNFFTNLEKLAVLIDYKADAIYRREKGKTSVKLLDVVVMAKHFSMKPAELAERLLNEEEG